MKNKLLVLALLLITISTQAQVGKWLLNNNANDATSNAINGTLTGSPTFSTTSKEGAYALVTNGTNQYIDLGNPSQFPSSTSARSISAWAMTNNVSGSRSIFAYGTNSTSKAMVIGQNGTSLIGGAFASNVTVTNFWATGVWHHICLTYDGTTAKLYADGSLVSSSAMSWSLILAKAYIGRGVNSSDYWSGSIDDVRIYNTALSATEVQNIATPPPAVPTGLTATSTAPTSVSLSWTDASSNETGFSVERSTTTGTGFSVLTTTAANATSYTDATATEGTNYFYRIQSTNVGGSSVYTSEATVTTLPNAPTSLTATAASATSITLNWTDASSKETGYDIERSLTSGSGFSVVGTAAANAVTYTDASLTTGTTYYYRLKSKVGTVGSVYSSVVSAVASIIAPTVSSSNLQFSNVNLTSLTLTWTPGNGQRRIVILREYGSSISRSPTNGQSNTANSDKSLAQNLGEHNFLVYDGIGSSVTITGLINSTAYAVGVFEYNGTDATSMYLINSPLTGSTTTAGAIRPTVQASNLVFSNVSQTSMTLSWTPGNGERRVIIASNGSSGVITKWPSNGQVVSANSAWSLGQNLDGNNHAVYDGTGSSVTITGLTPSTPYAFGIFEYNGGEGSSVYMGTDETSSYLTNALTGSQTTTTSYDFRSGAELLTNLNNWSSADAAYTTIGATGGNFDESALGGFFHNVWFKFQATTTDIDFKVISGGTKGTQLGAKVTLFDQNGNLLKEYFNGTYGVLQYVNLTIGSVYYISVDDANYGVGTFTVQVNNQVGFDIAARAYQLQHASDWSSTDGQFSNVGATGNSFDEATYNFGYHNVWFKFQATTTDIDFKVISGGAKGTLGGAKVMLFDQNGNLLKEYFNGTYGVLQYTNLNSGSIYYISVDDANYGAGTFTIQVKNQVGFDIAARAYQIQHASDWSSTDGQFSNVGATGNSFDEATYNFGYHNVWFKFQATTSEVEFKAASGGVKGTLGRADIMLFDQNGNLLKESFLSQYGVLQYINLTVGGTYYVSVDDHNYGAGTFTVAVSNQVGYDMAAKAYLIPSINNWTSADSQFSNVGATGNSFDESTTNSSYRNVWFKFLAIGNEVDINVLIGGSKGTMSVATLLLVDATGNVLNAVANSNSLKFSNLTSGNYYYFSVDDAGLGAGTFSLFMDNGENYDFRSHAILLTDLDNWSSADAAYTNVGATGTGFNEEPSGGLNNVWFKFQATTSEIDVRLLTGGGKGTLTYPTLHLFDGNGNLLDNERYTDIQRVNLTPGSFYYFSVDNEVATTSGTFSIQINDHVGYNMRVKAELLTNLNNWSSADAAYSNVDATSRGFNEEVGFAPNNVWFKFQATTNEIDIRLLTGDSKGTFTTYPRLYLYDEIGNPLDVQEYTDIQRIDLIPGSIYYIMVFSSVSDGAGTFTIHINDHVNYNMRAKAELLTDLNNWSSADAAYSNVDATSRGFNEEINFAPNNVWFKFQATTNEIDVRLLVGGSKGTLSNEAFHIYDENGNDLGYSRLMIQKVDLVPGSFYYVMIYNEGPGGVGTFSIQINDHVNYDMRAKAELLTNISDWKSDDAGYSNDGATGLDFNQETIGGYQNVWFKFLATTNKIEIKVLTGEEKGTLSSPRITLFDNDGNIIATEIESGHTLADLTTSSLIIGSNYYFSIDDNGGATAGTFSLELGGGLTPNALCSNLYCTDNGGIGVGTPVVPTGYKLAVNGKVIMEGAKIEVQTKWPDYVFEKDYPITDIPALKKYIEENGHLPNMPSAKTVEKNGIDVEEINVLLLQKIEEMSLYLIKMEERLKKLEQENSKLKKERKPAKR
jgi:hypothetical protein